MERGDFRMRGLRG